MKTRVTAKDLEFLCVDINRAAGTPPEPYKKQGSKFLAQAGNYHISGAYGGYALYQLHADTSITDIAGRGHIPARELELFMKGFLKGLPDRGKKQ